MSDPPQSVPTTPVHNHQPVAPTPGGTPNPGLNTPIVTSPSETVRVRSPPPIQRVQGTQPTVQQVNSVNINTLWDQLRVVRQREAAILREIRAAGGNNRPTSPLHVVSNEALVESPSAFSGTREHIFNPIRF